MSTIKDRIQEVIQAKGLNPKSFSDLTGIPAATVYNVLKGRNKPSFEFLAGMVEVLDISGDWLLIGDGKMIPPDHDPDLDELIKRIDRITIERDLLSNIASGRNISADLAALTELVRLVDSKIDILIHTINGVNE